MANNRGNNPGGAGRAGQVADSGRAGQSGAGRGGRSRHTPMPDRKSVPGRTPMPIELRAKQFMPFAAVTGLEKALREKEREMEAEAGD